MRSISRFRCDLAELFNFGNDIVLVFHDRQLTVKQTVKLLSDSKAIVLDLVVFFKVGQIAHDCIDRGSLFLNLSIELFTLCLLLRKLRCCLSILHRQLVRLPAFFLVFRYL